MVRVNLIAILLVVFNNLFVSAQQVPVKKPVNKSVVSIHAENSISNSYMIATYDAKSKNLEVTTKSTKRIFLKDLIPKDAIVSARKENMNSPVFGKGNALIVYTANGGSVSFILYPLQPFLFVNQTVKNTTADTLDINKLNPVSFLVNLGKPASKLKTLGTGGLLDPDKNPGSYVFSTTVDPATRKGVVTGWLTNERGSGVLFSNIKNDLVGVEAQIDYGHLRLPPGKSEPTETLLIGYFDDARLGEEQFADALAKHNNIKLRQRSAVYCSWYSEKNGGAGDEASSIELAKYIKHNLQPFGLGAIQLDDQWQGGGQYNGPHRDFEHVDPKGGYPNGMTTTANAIKKEGLMAGIWWMPFARNHQAPEYKDRQQWFARRTNGKPYETTWGGTSLDLTNPEVQDHIVNVSKTLHNWGFDYFKMDGLYTGTVTEQVYINDGYKNDSIGNSLPLYDPSITQIEAFRNGLKLIREATGNEVFLSGCCVSQNMRSFGASIGLVDAMRIGPDFNHDGQGIRTGAIRASRLYFLNGRVWWNDPDPSLLRESGKSTVDPNTTTVGSLTNARLLPSFVAISGQFFLTSDWLPDLPGNRIEILKRCMASHNGTARPVDAFDKTLPSIWLVTDKKSGTPRNVIGLFNWDTTSQNIAGSMAWVGLKDGVSYHAFDFWENKPLPDIDRSFAFDLPAESCRIIAVRAKTNHPEVVSTSQHVTQGMIDLLNEKWEDGTLSGTSKIIGGDPYELRIAGMNDGGDWGIKEMNVSGKEKGVTISVLPQTEKGWARFVISSKNSDTVTWQIKFKRN